MKSRIFFWIALSLSLFENANAQIGIGTSSPDSSSLLDLSSTTKGLLVPRMTTIEQLALINPAIGLTIFNTTTRQIETNVGSSLGGVFWTGVNVGSTASEGTNTTTFATTKFVLDNTNHFNSITSNSVVETVSVTDIVLPDMTITPKAGTYLVSFNSEYTNTPTTIPGTTTTTLSPYSSAQGVLDLNAAYAQIMEIPVTNTTHTITFGSGETLFAGVYTTAAALSIAGVMTLDGGGDPNAVFIFRSSAAIDTGAGTSILLTNGASACNVFWVAEGAIGLGAGTIMKGTLISHGGAVAMGAGGLLEGRLLSTFGAVAFGPGTATIPSNCNFIDLGMLSSFVMFTNSGALNGTGTSYITGNLGTNNGIIGGFATAVITGTVFPPGDGTITTTIVTPTIVFPSSMATFCLYQNGMLIGDSVRTKLNSNDTSGISLQTIATVEENQPIDVRWKVSNGTLKLNNRILTLIRLK